MNWTQVWPLIIRELSNLKLPWLPDFKVIHLSVNLCKLCLDIDFKLGDLTVNGNYEVNNVTLQKVLPVSSNGDVSVNFTDVSVKGRVGLLIQGDSFMPENYDVEYAWGETEVGVSYFVDKETKVENKITSPAGEQIIAETIWLQLREILTTILKDQLKGVVVEYSVQESLADEDAKLREAARYQSAKANGLFDTLLCAAKDYLVAKDLRTIETPPFDVLYRGKLTSTETGMFETENGYIKDLSTLSRLTDLSLFEDERRLLVYGTLGMREFKNELPNLYQYVDREVQQNFWFQQDGAPPHYYQPVKDFLNEWKANTCIGRGGPVAWPPRSPDLTPMDFYLWGYVKDWVFKVAPWTPDDMKERIREAFRNVGIGTLQEVQRNFVHRVQMCVLQEGRIFEHLIQI